MNRMNMRKEVTLDDVVQEFKGMSLFEETERDLEQLQMRAYCPTDTYMAALLGYEQYRVCVTWAHNLAKIKIHTYGLKSWQDRLAQEYSERITMWQNIYDAVSSLEVGGELEITLLGKTELRRQVVQEYLQRN